MSKEELLKEISTTLSKVKAEKLAALGGKNTFSIGDLIELSFYPRKEIAFRAAWILEFIEVNYPERFLPFLEKFLNRYPIQKNRSCQRHYTKIVMHLTNRKASENYQLKMRNYDLESIIETTFEWLIDKKTPIAVQVNCMEILCNLMTVMIG